MLLNQLSMLCKRPILPLCPGPYFIGLYTNRYIQVLILKASFLAEAQIDTRIILSLFLTDYWIRTGSYYDSCQFVSLTGNIFKILLQHCWSNIAKRSLRKSFQHCIAIYYTTLKYCSNVAISFCAVRVGHFQCC